MSYVWLSCILAGAAVGVWVVGVMFTSHPRVRDALQATIVAVAFVLMVLGFLHQIQHQ